MLRHPLKMEFLKRLAQPPTSASLSAPRRAHGGKVRGWGKYPGRAAFVALHTLDIAGVEECGVPADQQPHIGMLGGGSVDAQLPEGQFLGIDWAGDKGQGRAVSIYLGRTFPLIPTIIMLGNGSH